MAHSLAAYLRKPNNQDGTRSSRSLDCPGDLVFLCGDDKGCAFSAHPLPLKIFNALRVGINGGRLVLAEPEIRESLVTLHPTLLLSTIKCSLFVIRKTHRSRWAIQLDKPSQIAIDSGLERSPLLMEVIGFRGRADGLHFCSGPHHWLSERRSPSSFLPRASNKGNLACP